MKAILRFAFISELCVLSSALVIPVYAANVVSAPISPGRVYPNPWRADVHENALITFDSLPANSTIKLFTVSAHAVRTLQADSEGTAKWDRKNASGDLVASGIYIYMIADSQGHEAEGKLAIIK